MLPSFPADGAIKGAVNRATIAKVSWILCAEAGGRSTPLGGGMSEVTAYGLLTDVTKILGLNVS